MSTTRRSDAGAAVAGLFARSPVTGGLAAPDHHADDPAKPRRAAAADQPRLRSAESVQARLRLGVELTERQVGFLRELSRPARTGAPRTLGSKFVGTAILSAAIELIAEAGIDMHGVAAGDLEGMSSRARAALVAASVPNEPRVSDE